ncbi:hypothetical protein V5G24_04295 [Xanthobacter sp. VTT E-85241]|uniref:hypothetical protein n=1 Tax=Roseixanthobacter finlandensis TaxID=3119922 RepID=UPI00372638A4
MKAWIGPARRLAGCIHRQSGHPTHLFLRSEGRDVSCHAPRFTPEAGGGAIRRHLLSFTMQAQRSPRTAKTKGVLA